MMIGGSCNRIRPDKETGKSRCRRERPARAVFGISTDHVGTTARLSGGATLRRVLAQAKSLVEPCSTGQPGRLSPRGRWSLPARAWTLAPTFKPPDCSAFLFLPPSLPWFLQRAL